MRAFLIVLLALAGQAAASPIASSSGELVDRVVAVISSGDERGQRTLITLSDLEIEARMALASRGAARAIEEDLPPDTLAATLEWLVSEYLLLAEAEQLSVADVDGAELARALDDFEARLGEEEFERFVARFELGESDLARIFRRRISVDRYLSSRLRLGAVVSEAEVRAAFEARKSELGLNDFASARDSLRAQLERKRREEVVAALVADLRSRSQVRILHSFGRKPQEEAPPSAVEAEGSR